MKTTYIILAESASALRDGSFLTLDINGSTSRYINGDHMGTVEYDATRIQRISNMQIFTVRGAKKYLPACFADTGAK